MLAILIAVILLIAYGSLYPWNFHVPPYPVNPVAILLNARSLSFDRRFIADILINLALYVPVGMSGYLAFRRLPKFFRIFLPILLGLVLSASIEMAQIYVPGRRCSLLDLVNNTIGADFGVIGGMFFETLANRKLSGIPGKRRVDSGALALLLLWAGSLLFPLFPVMWLSVYRQKLVQIADGGFSMGGILLAIASAALSWYAGGRMLRAIGANVKWLWAFAALIPAQFFVITRLPSPAELVGAVAGTLAALRLRGRNIGWLFIGTLVLRGLWPFRFTSRHAFSFVPFGGFLDMQWQTGITVLLEKMWFLAAPVWLLRHSKNSLFFSTMTVAGVAVFVEVIQVWLPGRTAEITDPLLVFVAGLTIRALDK